jgi:GT2 family glycosyltransferase
MKHKTNPVDYQQMVQAIRGTACQVLPPGARALVISRGDEELVRIDGRRASHFPQVNGGTYAGHHPADATEAVRHLEELCGDGAEYLVVPSTSAWWLTHYSEFGKYLQSRCVRLHGSTCCEIFRLASPAPSPARSSVPVRDPHARPGAAQEALAKTRLRLFLAADGRLALPRHDQPVVSVVIPTYKQAHYTFCCLESLASCEASLPFEVIIVDNASTDDTRRLLARVDHLVVHVNERNVGFGEACNTGAAAARGEYLCFLNNDTLVTPGWLTSLVETVRRDPTCGAVGGKLIYPDGTLQEAGSIVWADGSGVAYGRGDDPTKPEYEYVREVDHCSAACFLIPRTLFQRIGGYDARYRPAYYEDTDLCLAIRDAGYRILFQPLASVIHMEFGSSGRDRAIELQLQNREKFVVKWRHRLRHMPASSPREVLLSRDRREGLRVLLADDRVPEAAAGSGFPRSRAMLDALHALGYVVTFLPLSDPAPHEPATTELQQRGVEVLHSQEDVRESLKRRSGLYDAAIVSRPHNAKWIPVIKEFNPNAAILYDAEAICTFRDALQAEVRGHPLAEAEVTRRLADEYRLMSPADVVMMVTESERRALHRFDPTIPACVWGNSLEVRDDPPGFEGRSDFLFVGSLSTPPNADALTYLIRELFPGIRTRLDTRLVVGGANPPSSVFRSVADLHGVVLTGFLPDLTPMYDRCRVFVAPHRFAAGIPHKVVEAMAAGIPCVVSQLLGDQLELNDGVEAMVARTAEEFRERAIRLYQDRDLWTRIQSRAQELVRDRYDVARMRDLLGACVDEAMARRAQGTLPAKPVAQLGGWDRDEYRARDRSFERTPRRAGLNVT